MTFPALHNDTFLRACLGQETEHTPVWLMRQAGRYLPEYRALREKAGSFMAMATNVELATEVTIQPLERFPLDAAILFSDILTVPDAMGLGLSFAAGEGPRFAHPVQDEAAIAALAVPDMDKLRYVFDAVTSIRRALNGRVPLIGFAGSPWTLACYMVEGHGSKGGAWEKVRALAWSRPELMERLLTINADAVAQYLNAQIDAGAQAVMLFDSWGGALADGAFQRFSLPWTARTLSQLKRTGADGQTVPRIVFTRGGGLWLRDMADKLDCDVLGVDWRVNLGAARATLQGSGRTLQGNMDPVALLAPPEAIRAEARRVLDSFGRPQAGSAHIFNLGHGVLQPTPPEHIAALVDEVHSHSRALRRQA